MTSKYEKTQFIWLHIKNKNKIFLIIIIISYGCNVASYGTPKLGLLLPKTLKPSLASKKYSFLLNSY